MLKKFSRIDIPMNIAVIGSWMEEAEEDWHFRQQSEFRTACTNLGKEISRKRHSLLVTSDRSHTADRVVVDGFISQIRDTSMSHPRIFVYRDMDNPTAFDEYYRRYDSLFEYSHSDLPNWTSNILRLVKDADTIIIIGGRNKTHVAASAAMLAKKRMIPIGSFGGAGQKILHELRKEKCLNIEVTGLENPWSEGVLKNVLEQSGIVQYPIFIVHGRDKQALQELKNMLIQRFELKPIILKDFAGEGKTIIEKFEQEAIMASYAFVILTPDDAVQKVNEIYEQGRPNAIFELGWFYGKLGRSRVCILLKRGTSIHTDIEGVSVIKFTNMIDEDTFSQIQMELRNAKIIL